MTRRAPRRNFGHDYGKILAAQGDSRGQMDFELCILSSPATS